MGEIFHRFLHLHCIACGPRQGHGHVGQHGGRFHSSSASHRHHALRQLSGLLGALHHGSVSTLDVEHEVAESCSEFFGHNGRRDEAQVLHRGRHIAGRVHASVGRGQVFGLPNNGKSMGFHNALKVCDVHPRLVPGNGLQLVDGASGVCQPSACNHGNVRTARSKHGRQHQGHRVSHSSRAVLVQHRAMQSCVVPCQHTSRIPHPHRQCHALVNIQVLEVDRHGECCDLGLGHRARGHALHKSLDLLV